MTTLTAYVSFLFGIPEEDLFVSTRKWHIVGARQVCIYMLREYAGLSFRLAGDYFGLDHATAIHAVKCVTNHYQREKQFREKVDRVINAYQDNLIEMPLVGIIPGCEIVLREEQYVSALQ